MPRRRWRDRLPPALRRRDYAFLWVALLAQGFGAEMAAVGVGWQVYEINRSPLDLGLVGLAEFLPLPLLALPAGQLADRFPRRRIYALMIALDVVIALALLAVTVSGADEVWPFFVLAFVTGCGSALGAPAGRALTPSLVQIERAHV